MRYLKNDSKLFFTVHLKIKIFIIEIMLPQKLYPSLGRFFTTTVRLQKTEDLITSAYLNQLKELVSKQK